MLPARAHRVLVACSHIERSDDLLAELTDLGLDPTPAFTAAEAVGLLSTDAFDALLLDEGLGEGMAGLLWWVGQKFQGVVVMLPERGEEFGVLRKGLLQTAEIGAASSLALALAATGRGAGRALR